MRPNAKILRMDSIANILVKTISMFVRKLYKIPLGSFKGLSKASMMLEIEINKIIMLSNRLCVVNFTRNYLNLLSGESIYKDRPSHTTYDLA